MIVKERFDIIFMDQDMKVLGDAARQLDGHETVQLIRERGVNCPVVMRTSRTDEGFRSLYAKVGADYLLPKDVSLANIKKKILPRISSLCSASTSDEVLRSAGLVVLSRESGKRKPSDQECVKKRLYQDSTRQQRPKRRRRDTPNKCELNAVNVKACQAVNSPQEPVIGTPSPTSLRSDSSQSCENKDSTGSTNLDEDSTGSINPDEHERSHATKPAGENLEETWEVVPVGSSREPPDIETARYRDAAATRI